MPRFTPRVKGKRRLDIGWTEGETWPGSTLGLDIPHRVPYSGRPEDLERHKKMEAMREPYDYGEWESEEERSERKKDPLFFIKEVQEGIEAGEFEPGFQHVEGTGTSLPYKTGSLDVVTSHHALSLNYDTWEGLDEAIRVLRPGGKLYVITPLGDTGHKEEAREIREWLRTKPVTNIKVSKEKTDYYETYGEEDELPNYIIRFTKL